MYTEKVEASSVLRGMSVPVKHVNLGGGSCRSAVILEEVMMYYFAYCTWLHDIEVGRYMPEAKSITKGYAANHALRFHAAVSARIVAGAIFSTRRKLMAKRHSALCSSMMKNTSKKIMTTSNVAASPSMAMMARCTIAGLTASLRRALQCVRQTSTGSTFRRA